MSTGLKLDMTWYTWLKSPEMELVLALYFDLDFKAIWWRWTSCEVGVKGGMDAQLMAPGCSIFDTANITLQGRGKSQNRRSRMFWMFALWCVMEAAASVNGPLTVLAIQEHPIDAVLLQVGGD